MSTTETHHAPAGTPVSVTIGPDRLSRTAEIIAIIRDLLLIAFMVGALVMGAKALSAISTIGTGDVPASVEFPTDYPTGCVGEEPCR